MSSSVQTMNIFWKLQTEIILNFHPLVVLELAPVVWEKSIKEA
ncbi:MAG: Uncharacterised protein [Synechococcus sp. CC9902]|nr:MAG: Uncharacterised protein [Synechococcus sp. CC9902]